MMTIFKNLSTEVKQYLLITGNYWAFTLTDGALRMLVILYFHQLGYTPLQIAMLFIFYEFFGVVTNLIGGWLGARLGLNKTMNIGLFLQIIALTMLLVPTSMLSIIWVMAAQALSGIAKDLNKMSAKSSIKALVVADQQGQLYQWVALLTGSKNALKGIGFFLGGLLLTLVGFKGAIASMAIILFLVWVLSMLNLKKDLGKAKNKPKFSEIFSKSPSINYLSAARLFLFASRDVWFVIALPVFLSTQLQWSHSKIGGFIALWIIGYGVVQSLAPRFTGKSSATVPDGRTVALWAFALSGIPALIALAMHFNTNQEAILIIGLLIFGGLFAINSSLHSYLIICYASDDGVSMDVGFYYMANALGRLSGTILSGWIYQLYGLQVCLIISTIFILLSAFISLALPKQYY
jgi:predicted MFS family arabinose efflux permease